MSSNIRYQMLCGFRDAASDVLGVVTGAVEGLSLIIIAELYDRVTKEMPALIDRSTADKIVVFLAMASSVLTAVQVSRPLRRYLGKKMGVPVPAK